MLMVDAISEKSNKNVVSVTLARGRGKSSTMGLAVAGAVCYGYSHIIVTALTQELKDWNVCSTLNTKSTRVILKE